MFETRRLADEASSGQSRLKERDSALQAISEVEKEDGPQDSEAASSLPNIIDKHGEHY